MTITLGPDYWDDEVSTLSRLFDRGGWMPHEAALIRRAILDRSEYVRSGVSNVTARYWTAKIQREIDERTRMRWDFKNGWTLDRWAEGRWQVVGVLGFHHIMTNLLDYLRERDMQRWPSPEAYMAYKRDQALKVAMANEYRNTQKLLGVIDKMSDKQVKEFITVEKAMQTGETITLHGATERSFRRMAKASKRSPAPPSGQSINPGGHPFKLVRNYKRIK